MAEADRALRKKQEQEYKKRIGDYLTTFTSEAGKRVLKDMRRAYCGHIGPAGNLEFDIGRRAVVKDIEAKLLTGKNPQLIEDLFRAPEDDGFEL